MHEQPTPKSSANDMTPTRTDTTPSSRSSITSADLDPTSTTPIFVYRLRRGVSICTEKELHEKLSFDPDYRASRCSSIPIPRGASRVVVKNQDLWSDEEKIRYNHYPNSTSSLASVGLPRSIYWKRILMDRFKNLYIISPDHSPASSEANSQDSSPSDTRHVSPANTFPAEEGEQAR